MSGTNSVQIALDPALGIDPAEFARAWNADEAAQEVGTAEVGRPGALESYIDPATAAVLVNVGVGVVSGVVSGVMTAAIIALVKDVFGKEKDPVVIEIMTETGVQVLRVK